ncbi:MAG: dTDP-4-dehydrorhamnose 3,5-epimerase [Myxococcaceae bacterium]
MKVLETALPEVLLLEPKSFGDARGFFLEIFQAHRYAELGISLPFVQDNWSRSAKGTLRGLHFQEPRGQGKLVMVTRGTVLDVAVDIRQGSPNFGKSVAAELSDENRRQLWVPPGFAHGFYVLSDMADFLYKCTDVYVPEAERSVIWNDPDLAIDWRLSGAPVLSAKDAAAPPLKSVPKLPTYGAGATSAVLPSPLRAAAGR